MVFHHLLLASHSDWTELAIDKTTLGEVSRKLRGKEGEGEKGTFLYVAKYGAKINGPMCMRRGRRQ